MARRGGRRGRRSRSRQNRSRRTSSRRTSSRRTSTRRSTPSSRRNSPSNRRATTSRKRQATRTTTRRAAPKRSAPTTRRTPTRNTRGSGISQSRKNIGRNVGTTIKNTAKKVASTVGRVTRPPSARAKTVTNTRQSAFNKQLKNIQATNKTFPGASPNSPLNDPNFKGGPVAGNPFARPGPGGPESEANYTSYKPGSFYNQSDTNVNMTNALRSGRNLVTSPFRALGINNGLTNRLIPKSNEAIQDSRDQRGPRPTLTRPKSRGGSSRIEQQVAATQMQPEIAPTIGTPAAEEYIESAPQGDLTRIQSQAYNTQLTSSLANMFGGQGSVGYTPQADMALSPTLRAGQSRGRRRVRMFGGRSRRGGAGDQFQRGGDRISRLTNINI